MSCDSFSQFRSRRARDVRFCGLLVAMALAWVTTPVRGQDDATQTTAAQREQADFFESKIRPLLVTHCYECHSESSDDVGGGLLLDSRAGWQRGGELGPAIEPGKPDASWLIRAVRHTDDALQMPPDQRLNPADVTALEQWVSNGAFDPRDSAAAAIETAGIDLAAGREFWAFRPLDPQGERVAQDAGAALPNFRAENPLDERLLSFWKRQGVKPTTPAKRRDWLRRVTFDLTGLPPRPHRVESYLADRRPDADSRRVDRLLASPAYGERWGRHWLNVARYADSNGMDENIAHGNAWRYRDYVVSSWNADKPFATFLVEQVAGDLLPDSGDEQTEIDRTIATGFLSLGPKVLAEVDETKMEMDIIDEQVETLGRAFLGLTLGCARCHDHKFDPISTKDYYALSGIFKSTKTMEHFTKIAKWNEVPIATQQQQQARDEALARVATQKSTIEQWTRETNAQVAARLETGAEPPENPEEHYTDEERQALQKLRDTLAELEAAVPELPTAMAVRDEEQPTNLPVHLRGNHLTLGEVVSRGAPQVLLDSETSLAIPGDESGRLQLARWMASPDRALTYRVIVNRVWRWHFGKGWVASSDNFGELGERPLDPHLLDWLAQRFLDQDTSFKRLHRTLLLSAFGHLDSVDATGQTGDEFNAYFTRAHQRRLDAESIRDAMLAVSGQLDRRMGGSLLHVGNREFLFDHTSKDNTRYDVPRRSLYLPVIRNHLYDEFTLFDYNNAAVPNSDRASSTVPSQALFLLNSPLVLESAAAVCRAVEATQPGDDHERLDRLYRQILGREPTDAERQRDGEFLAQVGSASPQETPTVEGWPLLAQSLLICNEFLYLP